MLPASRVLPLPEPSIVPEPNTVHALLLVVAAVLLLLTSGMLVLVVAAVVLLMVPRSPEPLPRPGADLVSPSEKLLSVFQ